MYFINMKKIIYKISLFVLIFAVPGIVNAQWETIGEMEYPVAGGQALVIGSKIYIIGGYSDDLQAPTDYIQEFDPALNSWKKIAVINDARYGLSAGVYNDYIYYFGGIKDSSDFLNYLESFTISDTFYTGFKNENESFNREFAATAVVNNRMYIFGGASHTLVDSLLPPYLSIFDFDSSRITSEKDTLYPAKDLPTRQMTVAVGGDIFIFGGVYNTILNKVYKYNIAKNSFSRFEQDMLLPRAAGVAVYDEENEAIFLIGGSHESKRAIGVVERFKKYGNTFFPSNFFNLNTARSDLMAVVFEGEIFVFGGYDLSGNVVSTVEKIDPNITTTNHDSDFSFPLGFQLDQNFPNPFNPSTTITYTLDKSSVTKLEIYTLLGQRVKILVDEFKNSGRYSISWDGTNDTGNIVTSGIYFYKLSNDARSIVKKLTLLR